MSLSVSRVMLKMVIYLDFLLPGSSSDLPWDTSGRRMVSCAVLLRMGFTEPLLLPEGRWALTSPFHPYQHTLAVYFCCTILRVASTGRYPASCPMKLGLSSPEAFRHKQARPFDRLEIYNITLLFICKESYVKITSADKFAKNWIFWYIFAWNTNKIIQEF